MALPPKGDPRRPLHLAVRSMRVWAGIFLFFASLMVLPMILIRPAFGARPSMLPLVIASAFYVMPGCLYLLFSIFLSRRQFWALIASVVLVSVHLALLVLWLGFFLWMLLSVDEVEWQPLAIMAVMLVMALALGQLMFFLTRSFASLRHVPPDEERGFEPLMPPADQSIETERAK